MFDQFAATLIWEQSITIIIIICKQAYHKESSMEFLIYVCKIFRKRLLIKRLLLFCSFLIKSLFNLKFLKKFP